MTTQNLTTGPILKNIFKLSLPIMGSSFVVMAYNITDMFWLGHVSSGAVAAVGAASFVIWFVESFLAYTKTGAEVYIAQSVGANQQERAERFARNAVYLALISSLVMVGAVFLFSPQIVSFFRFTEIDVIADCNLYLRLYCLAMLMAVPIMTINGIYNAIGRTKIPFVINSVGMISNMILDPLLIYGLGMNVKGAAIASVISHVIGIVLYVALLLKFAPPFPSFSLRGKMSGYFCKKIVRVGVPASLYHAAFSVISMCMARFVSQYGATAVAVQSLGSQIESLSWMTAGGFSTALSSFVGQNYGAQKFDRIFRGYLLTLVLSCSFGLLATIVFFFGSNFIYQQFMPDPQAVALGTIYLTIMAYSQIFMSLEITTTGAFNGVGKTSVPSFVGITLTAARIPLALTLMTWFALPGIWWSITLSSVLKGSVLVIWFLWWMGRGGIEKKWRKEFEGLKGSESPSAN